jgi:hypothetical protein
MACDICGKKGTELVGLSETIIRRLPMKYWLYKICPKCESVLNKEIDYWREIAWLKAATLLVEKAKGAP